MNKQETINMMTQLVEGQGTKKDSERYLEAFLKTMEYCVENEDLMKMVGYFSMEFQQRNERMGQNPQTLEKIKIPARKKLKFKIGKNLENLVKQK